MLKFKPISLEDRDIITSFTLKGVYRNCDFSFANMCSWQFLYGSEYVMINNMLLIRFWLEDNRPAYMLPLGKGDLSEAIKLLEKDAKDMGHTLCLLGVTSDAVLYLEKLFPGEFRFIQERDYYDYIYLRENLVGLVGKKYQSKRNHINRFRQEYDNYRYTSITQDMIAQCLELEAKWCIDNDCAENEDLLNERRSMTFALEHMDELGILGGAIWIGNEIEAFTFGAPITSDTFGVHVEKANTEIDGIYAVINKEFARHIPDNYLYVNREEDLGIPGLRKAKLSYHPTILLEKNAAIRCKQD